jgi:hypothetical protein
MRQATMQKYILISRSGAINRGLRAPLAGAEHDLPLPKPVKGTILASKPAGSWRMSD